MDKIISEFEKIGLSKLEASVYTTVFKNGEMTGYQISKLLSVAKSSVYNILDLLLRKGALLLIAGEPNKYVAEDPEVMIKKIKETFINDADSALKEINSLKKKNTGIKYINVDGFDNAIAKAKEIVNNAEKEILLNTDFDIGILAEELNAAVSRGVRVITFSWCDNGASRYGLENYSYMDPIHGSEQRRLLLVGDFKKTILVSNIAPGKYIAHKVKLHEQGIAVNSSDFSGVYSENPFLSYIIAEHIHLDIYLFKLNQKYGKDLIDNEIKINTIMENGEIKI